MLDNFRIYIKDFFWFLIKENVLVNRFYRGSMAALLFSGGVCVPKNTTKIIDKSVVRKWEKPSFVKRIFSVKGHTSGTTNSPMTVHRSIKSILLEEYVIKRWFKSFGVPIRPRIAVLRGDDLFESDRKEPPFWVTLPFTRRLLLSSYHVDQVTVADYFEALESYQPDIIMAYPSSIVLLANYALHMGWRPNWALIGVFTSSETFTKENQEIVSKVFGVVADHYGQAERVACLMQCKFGKYHVATDYSLVEFVEVHEGMKIVGTNIHNNVMPIHRYDTGDFVNGYQASGCLCGSNTEYVNEVIGRDDDYILLSNGRRVGRLGPVFKDVDGLVECQLEQLSGTVIKINYVITTRYDGKRVESIIKKNLTRRLGTDIKLIFNRVNTIPRMKSGKFKTVIRKF
ncbi:MAG: phenylacetate--CoA ligase family protein [Oceanospirillaceae bacterium]|nr:phenylacetate--CoA ligase family protein [Oceanospirillaceae bacterium]